MGEHEKKGLADEFDKRGRSEDEGPEVEGHMFKGRGEDFDQESDEFDKKGVAGEFGKKG
jgi:hypothetical protein